VPKPGEKKAVQEQQGIPEKFVYDSYSSILVFEKKHYPRRDLTKKNSQKLTYYTLNALTSVHP
jgi:hypothetical protein